MSIQIDTTTWFGFPGVRDHNDEAGHAWCGWWDAWRCSAGGRSASLRGKLRLWRVAAVRPGEKCARVVFSIPARCTNLSEMSTIPFGLPQLTQVYEEGGWILSSCSRQERTLKFKALCSSSTFYVVLFHHLIVLDEN